MLWACLSGYACWLRWLPFMRSVSHAHLPRSQLFKSSVTLPTQLREEELVARWTEKGEYDGDDDDDDDDGNALFDLAEGSVADTPSVAVDDDAGAATDAPPPDSPVIGFDALDSPLKRRAVVPVSTGCVGEEPTDNDGQSVEARRSTISDAEQPTQVVGPTLDAAWQSRLRLPVSADEAIIPAPGPSPIPVPRPNAQMMAGDAGDVFPTSQAVPTPKPRFSVAGGGAVGLLQPPNSRDATPETAHLLAQEYNPALPTQYQPKYVDNRWVSSTKPLRFRPTGVPEKRRAARTASWRARRKRTKSRLKADREASSNLPKGWKRRVLTPDVRAATAGVRRASIAASAAAEKSEVEWTYEFVAAAAGCAASLAVTPAGRLKLLASPKAQVTLASIALTDGTALDASFPGKSAAAGLDSFAPLGGHDSGSPAPTPAPKSAVIRLAENARSRALEALCAIVSRTHPNEVAGGVQAAVGVLGSVVAHARPWHGVTFHRGGRVPFHAAHTWLPVTSTFVLEDGQPPGIDAGAVESSRPDGVHAVSLKSWVTLHGLVAVVSQQLLHNYAEPHEDTTDFELEDGCEGAASAAQELFGAPRPLLDAKPGTLAATPAQPCEEELWLSGYTNAMASPAVLMASVRVARWIMSPSARESGQHHTRMRRRSISAMQALAPRQAFRHEAVLMPAILCGNIHALIR